MTETKCIYTVHDEIRAHMSETPARVVKISNTEPDVIKVSDVGESGICDDYDRSKLL